MAIVISTNDNTDGLKQEVYATHASAKENKPEVKKEAAQTEKVEETTDESATTEQEKVDKSLNYLEDNENEDEDASEEDDDLDIDENDEEDKPKNKNGFQKRINKLTKEKSELNKRLADLESKFNSLSTGTSQNDKPAPKVDTELKEPKTEDFDDYADFIKEKAKYELKLEIAEQKRAEEKAKLDEESTKILKTFKDRVKKAEERYGSEKWDEVVKNEPQYSIAVRSEIISSEYGPDMIYYLFKNPEELNKINNMTPNNQIKAIGKIEDKLAQALTKPKSTSKISAAPEPIKSINSKSTSANKKPDDMRLNDYRKFREKNK
jgi:hypothetical protein